MIEARSLTKRYENKRAVDDLTFDVRPGIVTGFLGPNGAGKTTTMRMILGVETPSSGAVTVGGRRYTDVPAPMREVGALLDARAAHAGRKAYDHLLCLAYSNGIPRGRVDEVLGLVGLEKAAGWRIGTFSLGMGQRLGIAAALLGDPGILMLDEPANGLDPEGIVWIRTLMRDLAAEGRTVLVSSHLMAEMALTADHLLVIGRGRILADTSVDAFMRANAPHSVLVRVDEPAAFAAHLARAGAVVHNGTEGALLVSGTDSAEIGKLAAATGTVLSELTPQRTSLEEAFMKLTGGAGEFRSSGGEGR
ncbi:ATP-binding cassette domain-containing protein [Kitasatospora sp. NPDC004723]|uniref:ABC transporter ATP-binding protein n=1 Tax=Kitasatospora sp. NPDC004723 TaxID=3154288 RepID=UPI0033AFF7F8